MEIISPTVNHRSEMGGQKATRADMLYGYELVTFPSRASHFWDIAGCIRRRLLGLRKVYVTVAAGVDFNPPKVARFFVTEMHQIENTWLLQRFTPWVIAAPVLLSSSIASTPTRPWILSVGIASRRALQRPIGSGCVRGRSRTAAHSGCSRALEISRPPPSDFSHPPRERVIAGSHPSPFEMIS
jgi:hypothetical protein